ncbi:MAG TPA: helix-turn-helix domain-containing protein, partial [Bacillota bacterium]
LQQEGPYEAWLPVLRRVAFLVGAALGQQSGGAGPVFGPGAELAQVLLSGQAHESALRARLALEQLRAGRWLAAVVGQVVFPERGPGCDPARFLPDLQQEADRGLPAVLPPDPSGVARLASALRGEHLILVLTADDPEHLRSGCRGLVERLANRVRRLSPGLDLRAGVGALRQRLDSLRDAVGEAFLVLRLRVAAGRDPRPLFFDDYPVPRFLLSVPPTDLRDLVRRELAPLLTLPPGERDALLATLEALLQFNWNISSAARRLHLARQSLYRRIQRLESLMGKDLDHSERRTMLLLALRARELVGF